MSSKHIFTTGYYLLWRICSVIRHSFCRVGDGQGEGLLDLQILEYVECNVVDRLSLELGLEGQDEVPEVVVEGGEGGLF